MPSFYSRLFSKCSGDDSRAANSKTRRTYARHDTDRCVVTILGQTFPALNWSYGGMELTSEEGIFIEGQRVAMILKFRLTNSDLEIAQEGVVIRSYNRRTSILFDPLKQMAKNGFQKVIDDEVLHGKSNTKPK